MVWSDRRIGHERSQALEVHEGGGYFVNGLADVEVLAGGRRSPVTGRPPSVTFGV